MTNRADGFFFGGGSFGNTLGAVGRFWQLCVFGIWRVVSFVFIGWDILLDKASTKLAKEESGKNQLLQVIG